MNTKHTPGPWHNEGITAWKEDGLNADQPNLATAHGPNAEANACLIAAAPDLLEALYIAEAALEAYSGGEASDLEAIREAIAKAIGSTH